MNSTILSLSQASQFLNLKRQILQRYTKKKVLPFTEIKGRKYYAKSDLLKLLEKRAVHKHQQEILQGKDNWLGISEVAKRLNVTRKTVYSHLKNGIVPFKKVPWGTLITFKDFYTLQQQLIQSVNKE